MDLTTKNCEALWAEAIESQEQQKVSELNELQLTLVGGGIGDISPH